MTGSDGHGSIYRGGEEAGGAPPAARRRPAPPESLSAADVCKCLCAISVIAVVAFVVVSLMVLLAHLPAASSPCVQYHPGTIVCRSEVRRAGTTEETELQDAKEAANSTEPAVTKATSSTTTDAPVTPEEPFTGSPFGYRGRGQPLPTFVPRA